MTPLPFRDRTPYNPAMQSKATTVEQYLSELPPDRREALSAIRDVIRKNLPKGYEEAMGYGMMGWVVPHSIYPAGYHCNPSQPVPFVGLASQKQYMSFYLMCAYGDREYEKWLRDAWKKAGKKLDMGKSCIRFKRLEDVPLEVVGEAVRRVPVAKYLAFYESMIQSPRKPRKAAKKKATKKKAAKKKAAKKK